MLGLGKDGITCRVVAISARKVFLESLDNLSADEHSSLPPAIANIIGTTHELLPVDRSQPKDGTLQNLLIWARNHKNDSSTFHCKVRTENVRIRKGWNYLSRGGDKCKKVFFDGTTQLVVVMFDETTTDEVKFLADSILESADEHSSLPPAIANIIGTTHELLPVDCSQPKDGTLQNLLIWARNHKNDSSTFHCKVRTENVRIRKGWNYLSRGGDKCKKVFFDGTTQLVVVMFDETTTDEVKFLADSILESADEHSSLPPAIANIIGLGNDPIINPSLSNMLYNSVTIHSNTTIRHDGRIHSYCRLKLTNIDAEGLGALQLPASTRIDLNQRGEASTSKYAHTHLKRNSASDECVQWD
nr:hypothetical protein [Tanacetum cinerariifolium]